MSLSEGLRAAGGCTNEHHRTAAPKVVRCPSRRDSAQREGAPMSVSMVLHPATPALPERVLQRAIELPVVGLMLAEVIILFSGVISRYVFHSPLGWTDELAGVLFLWLGMLGAAIALLRGEHMRLTFVLDRVPPALRSWMEAFGLVVALAFLVGLLVPAARFTEQEQMITT